MADKTGAARLRQAVENQAAAGEASFSLPVGEANAICDEVEDELARLAWAQGVPAPVDANGEVVPLTTKVMYDDDGDRLSVAPFIFYVEGGFWRAELRSQSIQAYDLVNLLHLTRLDSWERLEEDVARIGPADYPCDYFNHPDCGMPCYSCPAHTDAEDCTAELARDVLRRAKALAERDAKGFAPQSSPHEAKGAGRG